MPRTWAKPWPSRATRRRMRRPQQAACSATACRLTPRTLSLTYRVKIFDGVTFHDGSPLTVDDVIFSFERIKNPDTAASMAGRLADVESVVAGEGENEVLFKLS